MADKQYTFIDLFAGCGGLSEGFLQTGKFDALTHVEWEKPMVDTLRYRLSTKWGHTKEEARKKVIMFDIQKTNELLNGEWSCESLNEYGEDNCNLVKEKGLKGIIGNRHVNFIIGGPPCQAYSIHGRATDKNSMQEDYRNYLFESFCKIVDEFKPEVFVFENVRGLLSAKPGGIPVKKRIYDAFTSIGYVIKKPEDMSSVVFDASDFGVPQYRPRIIILGVRNDARIDLTELYKSISKEKKTYKLNVRDAIGFLPPLYPLEKPVKKGRITMSHSENPDKSITQHYSRNIGERERIIFKDWVSNNMNHISHQAMIDYYYGVTGHKTLFQKYKSLEWDKPSHTIVAHLSKDGYMFIHPDAKQERSISVREAACLQSFPIDFQFLGNTQYNFKMIGNAVPVMFAKSIATGICNVLDKMNV